MNKGFTSTVELARFEVLKHLQEGLTITQISTVRKVSRTAIYKVLSTLTKKGMIRNPKRGIYELTNKGIKGLHSLVGLRYNLRQHNLSAKFKVLESPRNWGLKRQELRRLPYFNRTLKLKNNDQDYFNYGNLWVKTTSKSVILKLPTIYAKNWEVAVVQAMQILEDSAYKVEKLFNIRLVKNFKSNITFISNEYARLQDALAKIYRSEGSRLYITGNDGKIWLITDFSFTVDELEFIHTDKATDDIDAVAPFLNDLRKNPTTMSEVGGIVKEMAQIQIAHSTNIIKHQKVLDKMLLALEDIRKSLNHGDVV